MTIWTTHAVPCLLNGFYCNTARMTNSKRFKLAHHGAVGRDGEFLQPLGAESRVLPMVFEFVGGYFEAHKPFIAVLDALNLPGVPGILVHPVWGQFEVYVEEYRAAIDARALVATIDVTFRRHALKPEVMPGAGPFKPTLFAPGTCVVNLAGYLAQLALVAVFQSAWLGAALTLLRIAGQAPELIDRTLTDWTAAVYAYVQGWRGAFVWDDPPDDQVNSQLTASDAVMADYRRAAGVREAVYQSIIDGGEYSAGNWADGHLVPGRATPPAKQHAALVACALWDTLIVGLVGNDLTELINRQSGTGELDAAAADAAAVLLRHRIQRVVRLQAVVNPLYGGPTIMNLHQLADSLVRQLGSIRMRIPPARTITLKTDNRPLALIAVDELGSAERVDEIATLNPSLRGNLNRLPRGTELSVPV